MIRFRTFLVIVTSFSFVWILTFHALNQGGDDISLESMDGLSENGKSRAEEKSKDNKNEHQLTGITLTKPSNGNALIPEEVHPVMWQPERVSDQILQPVVIDNTQPNVEPLGSPSVTSWVQLGAFRNPDNARDLWLRLRKTQSDILGDIHHRLQPVDLEDPGTLHLLQIGPLMSATKAKSICHNLAERNVECLVVQQNP